MQAVVWTQTRAVHREPELAPWLISFVEAPKLPLRCHFCCTFTRNMLNLPKSVPFTTCQGDSFYCLLSLHFPEKYFKFLKLRPWKFCF